MNDSQQPTALAPGPALWQLTALALTELGDALSLMGNAMLAQAPADDPRRRRIAMTLDRASAHILGQQYNPPNEALRQLWLSAPRLLDLAGDALDSLEHPNAPVPVELVLQLKALLGRFAGEKLDGPGVYQQGAKS
jgi:hypothetical protein